MAKKKIALDCGHGLKTAGKQTPDGIKEWTLNDKVRDKVVENLKDYDVEFVFTDNNEGNTDEGLTARRTMYINADVDVAVSIHHNAYTGTWNNATGLEVYVDKKATAKDRELAELIYNNMVSYLGMKGRGIKEADWTIIDQNEIPAVLTEGGFMDGIADYKIITSDEGQAKYAKAISDALISFLKLEKKQEVEVGVKRIQYTKYSKEEFIEKVAECVNAIRKEFGIEVASPIIAQACLESTYGTTNKATHNNYFGLKYRPNRCPSACGTFVDDSKEQLEDGTIIPITDQWFEFETLEKGIRGYFEYTSIDRYKALKGETDPKKYLEKIKEAGYATDLEYVNKVYRVITNWDLTKYDPKEEPKEEAKPEPEVEKWYRVRKSWDDAESQLGAYKVLEYAKDSCPEGYFVFDWNGEVVYPEVNAEPVPVPTPAPSVFEPYMVRINVGKIYDHCLNIREKADGGSKLMKTITDNMSVTIVEEAKDSDGYAWGLLKGYSKYRNGWIRLDYTERIK
jgi:flagellum-specific peptidoglycan hydrolase FlgJ